MVQIFRVPMSNFNVWLTFASRGPERPYQKISRDLLFCEGSGSYSNVTDLTGLEEYSSFRKPLDRQENRGR